MHNPWMICRWLVLTVVFACAAFSQAVDGTIVGTVTDASGGVVPGARVTLTEVNTKILHSGVTNSSGNFDFPNLPPGLYDVTVEMNGFKTGVKTGVILEANTSPRADLTIQTGEVNQTVVVSANSAPLQTERADTGRSISPQSVEELPLGVNRNFQSLLELVPGTMEPTFQNTQFFNTQGTLQTNVNGQPRYGQNYQIEGISNSSNDGSQQTLITPAEAIQTVSVSTSNHDPELGRSTGAVVNVTIKSGTNNLHGAAYEFHQNSALNARTFFNPVVGHLVYNYVGGNLGGPIKRNKVFFFVNYLRTMDREANTNQTSIPSDAFRRGDLSGDMGHQVYDPATGTQDGTGQNRVPFAGNIIPQSRINPVSAKLMALLPPTNQPFNPSSQQNDYFALLPFQKTMDQVDSKVDYTVTDKDRVSVRWSYQRPSVYQAPEFGMAGGPAQSGIEGTGRGTTISSGINYNRIVTPTLLTELRFGVAYYQNAAQQTDYGTNASTAIGIPGVNIDEFTSGLVGLEITGYSTRLLGYSANLPWDRGQRQVDIVNSWTKIHNNHQIKWGGNVRRLTDYLLQGLTYSPRGRVYFHTNQTSLNVCTNNAAGVQSCAARSNGLANDMASFLLDLPYQLGRDLRGVLPAEREWEISGYGADNWQVSSKLTVNLGLRWDFYSPAVPQSPGGFSNYNPANNTLVVAGIGGNPMNMGFQERWKYYSPRIGLAYRLTEKTVVRAGFGMSSRNDFGGAYNYPVRTNNLYVGANGSDSYGPAVLPNGMAPTWQNGFPAPVPVSIPSNGIIANPDPTLGMDYYPLNYKKPRIETWNFAVQRELPWRFVLDVAYVGNHGVGTPAQYDLNAGNIIGAGRNGQPMFVKYGLTGSVTQNYQGFSSLYNSLQMKFDRRMSKGFQLTTSFTWQKAMGFQTSDLSDLFFYPGQGLRRNYARADFDRTLNFVQSYIYQLPFGQGRQFLSHNVLGKIVGGWQVAGVVSWRTGLPLSFTGSNTLNLGSGGSTTLNQVAPIEVLGGIGVGNPWFSTTSFARANANVQGTTGRNIFSGPNLFGSNGSLTRTFILREAGDGIRLQMRLETFNLTNTPQFAKPNTSFGSNFGFITNTVGSGTGVNSTGGGRSLRLAAKVTF